MKKVILVDGNNLMFRSYYATAYSGSMMKNSKGFPTNGLFGFVNMMNKIIHEENPSYILVAFDIGKTFRHEQYEDYKGGRDETPNELKMQFPVAKEILTAMNIKYLEVPGYEADDIIGTFAKMIDENDDYEGLIVSSDKDLLQLISDKVTVKLLKSKDYIMMTPVTFKETYGVEPERMTDLKGLMGDASDNIPGVKGIGEKTAIKLLSVYQTLENLYDHIEELKGATYNKLVEGRESAFRSREIATIYREVPVDLTLEDIQFKYQYTDELINLYTELGFHSFIKKADITHKEEKIETKILKDTSNLKIETDVAIYLDIDQENYHKGSILGIAIYNKENSFYIPYEFMKDLSYIKGNILTYDYKKVYVSLKKHNIKVPNSTMDIMIACYLLNYNVKDDIAYVARDLGYDLAFFNKKEKLTAEVRATRSIQKAKFIYEINEKLINDMRHEGVLDLFYDIELPLSGVLAKMELTGIRCDSNILDSMGIEIKERIEQVSQKIYEESGEVFNISSPKQLGEVLFEHMGLPHGKKKKNGYSTDEATLTKLKDFPIIENILEYRMLTKLYSTYIEGLKNNILEDGKIHTIYTQTLTRTGRLSSIEPNLQNIPVRNEYGRLIRKSFIPEENSLILSSDYSQIELRIFAHLANEEELIHAFSDNKDIHSKTASDIYGIPIEEVTSTMRRNAKAVNFGIIYGISSYGLSGDLNISPKEAKEFINKYFETYPGIKTYMDETIAKAHTDGYVKTIMNRKRVIEELNNSNYMIRSMGERMALNTPIQGSSADILKKAMIEIDKKFDNLKLKSKMLLQIHDELVFNVYLDELETVKNIVREIMEHTIKLNVPLAVDINCGKNLYEAK
ncbi:MAG: DNA polymerase I [Erysipelotrichaceae bacterium]|nr:DNA polymerase I [Erysipelotrichaceae bacterium]